MIVVLLPAYNEEKSIAHLLRRIQRVAQTWLSDSVKVIVVDDGSSDHTAEQVQSLPLEMVELIRHDCNKGLGEAIRTGMRHALRRCQSTDVIVTMDADNTQNPGLIPRMALLVAEGNDVVIASRYRPGARTVGVPRSRQLFSLCMSWLFRVLFPIAGVRDYSCGFRAYRAGLLMDAFAEWGEQFISQTGFACMVEILLKVDRLHAIMCEVPLVLRYDTKPGASKMNVTKTIRQTIALAFDAKRRGLR